MRKLLFISLIASMVGSMYSQEASTSTPMSSGPAIAFITIDKDIRSAKPIIKELFKLAKDPRIKGLIIHMDSRGGAIGTAQALFSELQKFKLKKPVVVIVEDFCLSSAYYIAMAADFIFALPTSEVGSIGTILTISKYSDLRFNSDKDSGKLDLTVIRAGKYKDLGNPNIPLQNWHIKYYEQRGQKAYDQFVSDVALARNLSIADEKQWADGRNFFGYEALQLGLIDGIGDFSDSLEKMKELLATRGITIGDDFDIVDIKYE